MTLINRADAINTIMSEPMNEPKYPTWFADKIKALPSADITQGDTKDCTKFLLWLLEEIMDEENWEMNAVANGEVIARKLTNLGILEVKDGYYVRTSLTYGLQREERESLLDKIKNLWKK